MYKWERFLIHDLTPCLSQG